MAWRSGWLYLTDRRLFLYQQDFTEVIFQLPLENLKGMVIKSEFHNRGEVETLYLIPKQGRVIRLKAQDVHQLKQAIEEQAKEIGLTLEKALALEEVEDRVLDFLKEGERITHRSRMWHLISHEGVLGDNWKPGYLYLSNKRLCWWYEFERKVLFEMPVGKINASVEEIRDLSAVLKQKSVLDVIYSNNGLKKVASFSGKETQKWQSALNRAIAEQGSGEIEEEKETCPQCGKEYLEKTLLEKGCPDCGWVSPKLRKRVAGVLKV